MAPYFPRKVKKMKKLLLACAVSFGLTTNSFALVVFDPTAAAKLAEQYQQALKQFEQGKQQLDQLKGQLD